MCCSRKFSADDLGICPQSISTVFLLHVALYVFVSSFVLFCITFLCYYYPHMSCQSISLTAGCVLDLFFFFYVCTFLLASAMATSTCMYVYVHMYSLAYIAQTLSLTFPVTSVMMSMGLAMQDYVHTCTSLRMYMYVRMYIWNQIC